MVIDGPFVDLADNNCSILGDKKIPQAAIDVKRIQIVLKYVRHESRPDGLTISPE